MSRDRWSLTGDEADDVVVAEIGAALGLGQQAAAVRVERARAAVGPLAGLTQRMVAGDFGEAHLFRAVDLCAGVDPQVVRAAVVEVAGKAPAGCTPVQLRGRLQRALVKRDPGVCTRRVKAARRDRGSGLWADADLRGRLEVHGCWTQVVGAHNVLTDWAYQRKDLLRELRQDYPRVRLCCPTTITNALTAAGVVATGVAAGSMSLAHAHAVLAGPDRVNAADGGLVVVECRWCASTDMALPTVDQLRADGLIAAVELLAQTMQTPAASAASVASASGAASRSLQAGQGRWAAGAASVVDGVGSDGEPPGGVAMLGPRRGRRWSHAVVVVVDLKTALGLAEEPGWVPGYGPVPAPVARELAAAAVVWQRFLLDDDQRLVSTGRFTYRPSDRLRELVTARDLTCTFPGCGRPAGTADLDHRTNFDGTNTTADNLHPLCRSHHRLKTHTDWHIRRDRDGHDQWTSPLGHTYTHTPHNPWIPPATGGLEADNEQGQSGPEAPD